MLESLGTAIPRRIFLLFIFIGFLPGTLEEKICQYEEPYISILDELFPFSKSYQNLKELGKIDFVSSSFLRGRTFDNCIIIVDELQNMLFSEIDTIITRLGQNSRIIFCGDSRQTDIGKGTTKQKEESGFLPFLDLIENHLQDYFDVITFSVTDCVRSRLVRQYLLAKEQVFENKVDEQILPKHIDQTKRKNKGTHDK